MPRSPFDVDGLTLNECMGFVRRFHARIKAPIATSPQTLPCDPASALAFSLRLTRLSKDLANAANGTADILLSRAAVAVEELAEWLVGNANGDLIATADALGDRLYILLGDAVATGLPLPELLAEIHESNMTKISGVTTGYGRGAKGPAYVAPNIALVLQAHSLSKRRGGKPGR
jgi:predicted HAD superfamily Cof-like phosphohydrolase